MTYQRGKIYRTDEGAQVKERDLLVSDILERALNGGIKLDYSIMASGVVIDLIAGKPHIIVVDADKGYRDDSPR